MKMLMIHEQSNKKNCSYIAMATYDDQMDAWFWFVIGSNGKLVLSSKYYDKKSYAVNRAKSFCAKVEGVRYDGICS